MGSKKRLVARNTFCALLLAVIGLQTARAKDVCLDQGKSFFTCTDDATGLRIHLDDRALDLGVTQRVDGSEDEKHQIRDVIQRMNEYFAEEVLSIPEYEHVRYQWYVSDSSRF